MGAITELFTARPGLGEFSLLFPALAAAGKQGHWLLLIDPPWIPYPATLHGHGLCLERLLLIRTRKQQESLWACEQALRSTPGSIVLAWPRRIRFPVLRRLQLAAESQSGMVFLFRPETTVTAASPAALRLRLENEVNASRIEILKCRGHAPAKPIFLRHPQDYGTSFHDHGSPTDITRARTFVAGDTAAAPGAGLPYARPARARQAHRHH